MATSYDELRNTNLIRLLAPHLKSGALKLREPDGKFYADFQFSWDAPWVYTKVDQRMNCFLWKDITFHAIIEKQLPRNQQWVPIQCQDCYKVVVRPQTLKQLFILLEIQRQLDHPSKCGTEERPSVFGNYGGYFYNRGIREGLNCYKKVRKAVDEADGLGSDVKVILKRGCTEYEFALGRSDQWKPPTKEQLGLEIALMDNFVSDRPLMLQPEMIKNEIKQRWIEKAYHIGDPTVLEYTNSKPLYPDYVTYQHLAEQPEEEEYVETGETRNSGNDSQSADRNLGGSEEVVGDNDGDDSGGNLERNNTGDDSGGNLERNNTGDDSGGSNLENDIRIDSGEIRPG